MRKNTKAGRPAFKATALQRRLVTNAAASGMSHEQISIAIGVSRNTLEKYFEKEISTAALRRRMEVMDAMARTALKGNVAAQKAFLALASPTVSQGKPVGKKEQANAEAVGAQAGTEWEDLLDDKVTPIRRART